MAKVLTITKDDNPVSIQKKLKEWKVKSDVVNNGFPAHRFTGKITSYGDGEIYQRKLRDEWE